MCNNSETTRTYVLFQSSDILTPTLDDSLFESESLLGTP